jgi:hypothetical protein
MGLAVPGLLGTMRDFTRFYRNPIEKRGDEQARARLVGRLKPFLLRRKKDDVLHDLPPKTTMGRSTSLALAEASPNSAMTSSSSNWPRLSSPPSRIALVRLLANVPTAPRSMRCSSWRCRSSRRAARSWWFPSTPRSST